MKYSKHIDLFAWVLEVNLFLRVANVNFREISFFGWSYSIVRIDTLKNILIGISVLDIT